MIAEEIINNIARAIRSKTDRCSELQVAAHT
jgi:hypothetical protein